MISTFEGSRSSTKRNKALSQDPLKEIQRKIPSKLTNENHPKIAPKMTRKSQRAKKEKSTQC
jgi:hypothetical protein